MNVSIELYSYDSMWWEALLWRHNWHDGVSDHQPHDCLLNSLFRRRWNKLSKHRVTGLCEGNSPVTDEFLAQRASSAENVSIWWRHHDMTQCGGQRRTSERARISQIIWFISERIILTSMIIVGYGSVNERPRYTVTSSFICGAHALDHFNLHQRRPLEKES